MKYTSISIEEFVNFLDSGLAYNTIKTYSGAIKAFKEFTDGQLDKEMLDKFVEYMKVKYKNSTIVLYSIAINKYLRYIDSDLNIHINLQKIQITYNSITHKEYNGLLSVIKSHNKEWLYWIVKAIARTGIRYGELRFLTVEALEDGFMLIRHKGRERIVLLPDSLCNSLTDYCKGKGIYRGLIFHARDKTKIIDNSYLRRCLIKYATLAKIKDPKIYPHKFRHLFAKAFIDKGYHLPELADLLGHVSLETTRIYTRATATEIKKRLESLDL